jgi:HK97 gp10 family phage protein
MADDITVVVDYGAIKDWLASPEVGNMLVDAAQPGVSFARAAAPRRTGAGADSIRAEPVLDDGEQTARVSWDRLYYYMRFQEQGTQKMPAHPFLGPAFGA